VDPRGRDEWRVLSGFVRSSDASGRADRAGGRCDESDRAERYQVEAGGRWSHDRFAESDGRDRRNSWLDEDAGHDGAVFDPYAGHARVSKAYAPEEHRQQRAPNGPGRGGSAMEPRPPPPSADRAVRDHLPSHDEYEWKSRAGGVAIFVRKPAG
jgi:hypothetical protein